MATLIADRFLDVGTNATIDIATGELVVVRIDGAGGHAEQQLWTEACAKSLSDPRARLIDFGFIGCDRRFEASLRTGRPALCDSETIEHTVEWLENTHHSSAGLLVISGDALVRPGSLPRALRLQGFVPVRLKVLEDSDARPALLRALSGRSVVLLQDEPSPFPLALGFLKLLSARARRSWAIVGAPARGAHKWRIAHAAEGHAAFGQPAYRRFTLRGGGSMANAHAARMLDEARSQLTRGRHAAAERSLRASLAAFERRDDMLHAGDAALLLGQLLLTRGRALDAHALFEGARAKYEGRGAAREAVSACILAGLAQTDRERLSEAEDALRAAYSAATALGDADTRLTAGVALSRCLFWQARYGDASELLETLVPEDSGEIAARYWCRAARLRAAANDLSGAWNAVRQGRDAAHDDAGAACESVVRTAEAIIQARLGDVEALECHVRAGLRAAAEAHLPLQALRLRLTLLDGLLDAKRFGRARDVGGRLQAVARLALPPLLARRVRRVTERLAAPSAHETAPMFTPASTRITNDGDVDGLTQLLSICHDIEDERDALSRAAATIKKHAGALALSIFGAAGTGAAPLAIAGTVSNALGHRCITVGQSIGLERVAGGFEAAAPIRYAGRVIGSVACRWSIDGPVNADRTMAFCAAAASACAPLVYTLLERESCKSSNGDEGRFDFIGVSPAIDDVRRAIGRAASAPFTVLIEGESGSGKELVARAIHRSGCRRERRFCPLNCAALPEDLVDAELFGHAKGAFTGAAAERLGLFESADQGTVFLDEVGELSARAQAKLLRVLQEGEIRRIGESFTRSIDARLVAATNRSLRAEVEAGRFRQDLLYRLDVIRISVPPLRERIEDIPLLAARFWRQAADRIGSKAVLGPGALSALARYDWPGNVRELQNVLTGMVVAVPARGVVGASQVPAAISRATPTMALETLDTARLRFEQRFVRAALARAAGHRGQTAAGLGLSRQGLAKLMHRLGIEQ